MRALDLSTETIVAGIEPVLPGIQADGPGRWKVPFRSGRRGYLYIKDAWVCLDARIGRPECADVLWNYLVTDGLHGNVRFALDSREPAVHLRADLPFDVPGTVPSRLSRLGVEFEQTLVERPWEKFAVSRAASPTHPESRTARQVIDLARLCSDSGWEAKQRDGRMVSISLDGPGGYRARVEPVGEATGVWVELASLEKSTSSTSRNALAVLLLTVAGMTRLVRPRIRESEDAVSIVMETLCEPELDANSLNHALCALSVACRLCGEELEALGEERTAERYLQSSFFVSRRRSGEGSNG